ncbi:AraC family transcriptional regulator [uncultured Microbulbifer sp.]|uniref:helix-turn-helix transcriptional regulator n=1 Tax=uncultured Microbulbifer sp. TaxID=348147 RepID=UPI00262CE281|nr:AraC family transcriptional regulator [uncultured Microbulbifer sp.]
MQNNFVPGNHQGAFFEWTAKTDNFSVKERWWRWKELMEVGLPYRCELQLKSHHNEEYSGEFAVSANLETGEAFARACFSGNTFKRASNHLSDGYSNFTLIYLLAGRGAIQRGKYFTPMNAGGLYLVDLAQTITHDLVHESRSLLCRIPRGKIEKYFLGPEDSRPLEIDGSRGPGLLLRNYLLLFPQAKQQCAFVAPEILFNPISDLIIACLQERRGNLPSESESPSRLNAIFRGACQLIHKHCRDTDLSARQLAVSLGICPSYLHRALRYHQTSYVSLLRRARIEAASAQLLSTGRDASILQVAFNCGFNGTSQFSRAFREELGISASEFVKRSFAEKEELLKLEE